MADSFGQTGGFSVSGSGCLASRLTWESRPAQWHFGHFGRASSS
ncbi:hypothetical protein [Kamptonema formosum]|nr:hypothetical protein [Oscillatoria sp. PCC 10802]